MGWMMICLIALSSQWALAHKNHHHGSDLESQRAADPRILSKITNTYNEKVRSIFGQKCMDCHSAHTRFPWYYQLPIAKGLIEEDIKEARTHLDIGNGYPFQGHGNYISDLEEIARTVQEGSMPPLRYRIMHPSSRLTEEERKAVLGWIEESLLLLKEK